jgi:hypothetical protein
MVLPIQFTVTHKPNTVSPNLRHSVIMLAILSTGDELYAAGLTGSGETITLARIIEQSGRAPFPALAGPALQPDRISRSTKGRRPVASRQVAGVSSAPQALTAAPLASWSGPLRSVQGGLFLRKKPLGGVGSGYSYSGFAIVLSRGGLSG